jgi:predicted peptidase
MTTRTVPRFFRLLFLGAWIVAILAVSRAGGAAPAADAKSGFDKRQFQHEGATLHYHLAAPAVESGKKAPLVLCLHGAGERGDGDGRPVRMFQGLADRLQASQPCFVLIPQVPGNQLWATFGWGAKTESMADKPSPPMALTMALIDRLLKDHPVDPNRLYVTGYSMGGYGTWEAIQRWPDRFAAAVPICGGGDPALAAKIKSVPLWAFHGDKDNIISVDKTRRAIEALKQAGGTPKYTEYPGVKHGSWGPAYSDPELIPWLFAQKRSGAPAPAK